jgi:hypothetical protein
MTNASKLIKISSLAIPVILSDILLTLNELIDRSPCAPFGAFKVYLREHQSNLTYRLDCVDRRFVEQTTRSTVEHEIEKTS